MMKGKSLLFVCLLWCGSHAIGGEPVPRPVSLEKGEGSFVLTGRTSISYSSPELIPAAQYLSEHLPGLNAAPAPVPVIGTRISLDVYPDGELPPEGYLLRVTPYGVTIRGADYAGVINGIHTFLQLLPPEVYRRQPPHQDWTVQCVEISDWPRYGYRGFMIDAARTFMPVEDILRAIDRLAYHKINKLHLHLTDDEGWRVEIKAYPELTAKGGFRGGDSPLRPVYGRWNEKYGGYYTQDELRRIVEYAAIRNIEVIPEIELPGHGRAAARSYPEILCNYTPDLTASAGYDLRNVWCASREENYAMIDAVIGEICDIFPSAIIHLGGDEVEPQQWSRCPDCRALMAEKGLTEPLRLEDIFMERAEAMVAAHGRTAGVWNEAVRSGKLDRSTVVWGWENVAEARKAAAAGYPTVAVPGKYFYFDMRQSPGEAGHTWAGIVTLQTVYSFDAGSMGFTAGEAANLLGLEATFFSELLLSNGMDFFDYQLYPRVCALAEAAWTPQAGRSWTDFEKRLENGHYARLAAMGIKYRTQPAPAAARPPMKTPAVKLTSSLAESARFPFANAAAYKGASRSAATCRKGDWFLFEFASPVACSEIRVATGYAYLPLAGIPDGRAELSYDGKTFTASAPFDELLGATLRPEKPVRAVRLVSDGDGNGESRVIIQPLEIR